MTFRVKDGLSVNGALFVDTSTNVRAVSAVITGTTGVTSAVTGALQVAGGVGVGGSLFVGGVVTATSFVGAFAGTVSGTASSANNLTGGTAGQIVYQSASGTTAFTGPGTAGQVLVSNGTSAPVYQNTLTLAGNAAASSTTTGALQVVGGIGVGGDIYVGGTVTVGTGAAAVSSSGGDLTLAATGGNVTTTNIVIISNTTGVTSAATGALRVAGGVGVAGGLYVGGVVTATSFAGSLTGNADTATSAGKWTTARTFTFGGDLSGSMVVDGSQNVTFTATIAADSIALGTDTTGVYVATATAGTGISVAGSGSETAAITITNLGVTGLTAGTGIATNGSTGSLTLTNVGVTSLTGGGGVTVSASTGSITLGFTTSTLVQTASNLAGGTAGQLHYQSAAGTTAFTGPGTAGQILVSNGTSAPAYQNTLTLAGTTVSSSTTTGALVVAGGLGVGGDLNIGGTITAGSGAASVSSTGDLTLTATGGNVTTTNVVIISNTSGVTSAATGALRVAGGVGVGGGLYVGGTVTATSFVGAFAGTVAGNADTASKWATPRTFTFGGDLSGSMVVDGSQNVTFTATIAADSVALGTDTTGNYVATATAGTGISVAGSGSETAAITITNLGVTGLTAGTGIATNGSTGSVTLTNVGVTGLTAGGGVTVSASTGSVTLGFTTSTLVTTASNLAGGSAGQLAYQSAAGTTTFLALSGTQKSLLTAGASAPVYVTQVQAQSGTGSKTAATGQSLVVTAGGLGITGDSYFANDLATGGTLTVNSTNANTGTNTSNAIYTAGGAWVDKSLVVGGSAIFQGAVSFQGTATYVYSTQTLYSDNLIQIHAPGGATPSSHTWGTDDGLDVGHIFHYYKTSDKDAFLGWKNGSTYLEYWENGTETGGVYTGSTWGTFRTGAVKLVGGTANAGNTSTGDLTVLGGVGVGGGLYVGGTVTATSFVGAFAGTVSGNADTASKWATPRTFTFGGDLSGSMVVDGSQNVTFTATIAADSVALGTDTTGNYVAGVSAGTAMAVSGSGSENATVTITNLGVGSLTAGTGIATNGSTGTVTLTNVGVTSLAGTAPISVSASTGSVTLSLTTASTYVANATKVDTIAQTANASYYVTFVDANNATSTQEVVGTTSTLTINPATGAVGGTSLTLSGATASSSTTTGALVVSGGAGIGGNLNVGGTITVGTGAAVLGSTGDLTLTATGGNVTTTNIVVISNTTGVTSAATGALRVAGGVGVGGGLYVGGTVTATSFVGAFAGSVTGNADTASKWATPRTFTFGGDLSGSMVVDGSQNVTFTATIAADSIALGTDTTGNYVATAAAGTGISVAGSGSETAAITITNLGVTSLAGTAPIAVSASTGSVTVSLTTASTYVANAVNAEKWLASRTVTFAGGDVTGSFSIDGSANVSNVALTIAADSIALGTDTTGNYVATATAGTGISVAGSGSETAAITITNLGVTGLTAGGGVTVSASTGSVTLGFTTSTLVTTASNLAGGTAGQLAYQSAAGTTAFAGPGTAGQILVSAGASAPVYTSTSSIYVNRAVFADSASGSAGSVANALTIGSGLSGGSFNGSSAVTITNLGVTSLAGTAPIAVSASTGSVTISLTTATTYAGNSARVDTVAQTGNATYYATFVDANNAAGAQELVYTTSTFTVNPATGALGATSLTLTGNLVVQGTTFTVNSTVTNVSDPIITIGSGAAGAAPAADDNKDRGIAFQWHNGATAKVGFFGYDDSTGYLAFVPDATITNEVVSGSLGDIQATNFRGALVGNSDTATSAGKWTTARTFTFGGDLSGSMVVDGSQNVTFTATIAADSVALGTDTTGNYVSGISAGTAIAVSGSGSENATVTITNLGVASAAVSGTGLSINASTGTVTITSNATNLNTVSTIVARDASGNFSAGTITATLSGNATNVSGTVAVANGGTGQTTYTDGQLLIGNTTGNTLTKGTLTPGTAIGITNGNGSITINNSGVTSNVAGTGISVSGATGAVTITNSGVTSAIAGTGISVSGATGGVTITNSGVTSLTAGGGVTVSAGTGGVTLGFTTSTLVTTASNLAGGSAGNLHYQTGAGASAFIANGTAGQFLRANVAGGTTPVWSSTGTFTGGTASSSTVAAQSITITSGGVGVTGDSVVSGSLQVTNSLGIGTVSSGVTGEIRATNEITAYYSDRRLKENVKVIDNAVTKVLSLNGITYTPNELAESFGYDRNVKLVGLFADEVEAILPEATRPAPFDQDENGNSKSGENYKTIQYEKLVPLLIEAIKEQQQQIAQLYDIINNTTNK